MKIVDRIIPVNKYNRPGTKSVPKRICIHWTANPGSGAAYQMNVAKGYFKNQGEGCWTSSQYLVGISGEIIRCVPDDEIAYAASGNNNGTIHIEVCIPDSTGKFTDKSVSALSELVPYLMGKYGIDSNNVVRHYDLTGKHCPFYYVEASRWNTLKKQIIGTNKSKLYRIQVGAFGNKQNAENYCKEIQKSGYNAFVVEVG